MKKILVISLLVLSIFMFNSSVFAEEIDTCYNDYLIAFSEEDFITDFRYYDLSSDTWKVYNSGSNVLTLKKFFRAEPGKTYYFRFFIDDDLTDISYNYGAIATYAEDYSNIARPKNNNVSYIFYKDYFTITIPETWTSFSYITLILEKDLFERLGTSFAFSADNLITCETSVVIPDNPTPTETEQTKILSDFYTVCIEKISDLSTIFTENKLLLAIPTVSIFIFIFLLVFRRYIT